MKKLFKHILLFILPVLLLIYFIPLNDRLRYSGLKDDCMNQGEWIYNRVYNEETPIDIAFLGSSHTINAIDDSYISKQLSPLVATNLGYCRLGRNLHYSLLKLITTKKSPKHIVLEIREREDRYSHPIFPMVSETKDVIHPTLFVNRDYFSDVWVHMLYKLELIQDYFYKSPSTYNQDNIFAFGPVPDTVATEHLVEMEHLRKNKTETLSESEQVFYYNFPNSYIERIHQICNEKGITLSFIYIPGYGFPDHSTMLKARYESFGPVFIPPKAIFDNTDYWVDKDHLNTAGGSALSKWIADTYRNYVTQNL